MRNLIDTNGASQILLDIASKTLEEFKDNLIGIEMGIAYGGGVESIGKMWTNKGIIYGFDTFEGHHKEIALKDPDCDYSINSFAATCMDGWYSTYDHAELTLEYQESELNRQNINNVKLVKGLITENTNIDFIPYVNYCLIDLDFSLAMKNAYKLVEPKLVSGAYLCLHDVIPHGHIKGLNEFYEQIKNSGKYTLMGEFFNSYLAVLKKK
jgi:hypothetical protein